MNFLAHIYLSGGINEVMIGNFIGDYVKGKGYENFSPEIQRGILLHRKIDSYTDKHPLVRMSTARFKPCYQRYASVVIDVVYDHYLACMWDDYSDVPLATYVDQVHAYLLKNYFTLPRRVKAFLPFLIKSRRLENYKYLPGVERSLLIMANHTSLPEKSKCATRIISEQYDELKDEFVAYFNDVRGMVNACLL